MKTPPEVTTRNLFSKDAKRLLSVIIPTYNEKENIHPLCKTLKPILEKLAYDFEVIFVDDGSRDGTLDEIKKIAKKDARVKYLQFSRNFGKETATTCGINYCSGDACILIDADLQHPVELIPEFVKKWEEGFEVVVGVRKRNKNASLVKKIGSFLFYKINRSLVDVGKVQTPAGSTDFRLLDRVVIDAFNAFTEKTRMTRGLIDWLGFRRAFISFEAKARAHGEASYTFLKLFHLAVSTFISMSLLPLKFTGYLGGIITVASGSFGLYLFISKYFFDSRFAKSFSGPAQLAILTIFLVGIILMSLGIIALYTANIQSEVRNRPMYVVRRKKL